MLDFSKLLNEARASKAQIEAQFSADQLELIRKRDQLISLIASLERGQTFTRVLEAVGQAAHAAGFDRVVAQPERAKATKQAANKTDKILEAARKVLVHLNGEASFRQIFDALPDDVRTIWGDASKEGIRSTLKRAGKRVGIQMLPDKRFRLVS